MCFSVCPLEGKYRELLWWGQTSLALLKHCFCQSCFYSLTWKLNLSPLCKRIFFLSNSFFFFLNIMRVIIYVQNKQCNSICISGHRMLTPVKSGERNFFYSTTEEEEDIFTRSTKAVYFWEITSHYQRTQWKKMKSRHSDLMGQVPMYLVPFCKPSGGVLD